MSHLILKPLFAVFATVILVCSSSQAQPPDQLKRASALFQGAVEKYDKGQYDAAIIDYTEYLKIRPTVAAGWFNRGIAYKQKADVALSQADYRNAVADFTQAIKLDPKDKDFFLNRAKAHSILLRVDFNASLAAAVADYSEAIKLDPNFAAAYSGRGRVYEESNQLDKAFADLNRAIELNPNDEVAYYTRAKIYSFRKNYTAARNDLEKALRLSPGYEQAKSYLSYVNSEASKSSTPVAVAKPSPSSPPVATTAKPQSSALDDSYRRTEEAERAGNNAQVVALATRTLELIPMVGESLPKVDYDTPLYIGTLRMRAKALSAMGKHAESDRDFKEAGMASLRNVNRFIESGTARLQRDMVSPAGWVLAELEVFKGVLACRSGVAGMKEWDAAVQRSRPTDFAISLQSVFMLAGVRENCALALINLGDYRAGKESDAVKRTKQLNEALEYYNEAVGLSPRDPRVYQGRAKIYRKLGRIDLALADEKKVSELPAKK